MVESLFIMLLAVTEDVVSEWFDDAVAAYAATAKEIW